MNGEAETPRHFYWWLGGRLAYASLLSKIRKDYSNLPCYRSRRIQNAGNTIMRRLIASPLRHGVTAAAFVALTAGLTPAGPALAFDCPVAQPQAKPGILKETPAQIAAVGKQLASGDTNNAIAATTADLRMRYPGVERAELVNYLMTAYCPAVAANPKLSDSQKRSAVDAFASQVMRQVY